MVIFHDDEKLTLKKGKPVFMKPDERRLPAR